MTRNEIIARAVGVLSATFGVEADEMLLESYRTGLSEMADSDVQSATAIALKSCQFMPKPAELIEFATDQRRRLPVTSRAGL